MYRNTAVVRVDNWEKLDEDLDARLKLEVQKEFGAYFKFQIQNSPPKKR
jgi:hypothetical protein